MRTNQTHKTKTTMKYLATITLAIAATLLPSPAQLCEDPYQAMRQQQQLDEIQRQTQRINNQLRDERDARFHEALRRGDTFEATLLFINM